MTNATTTTRNQRIIAAAKKLVARIKAGKQPMPEYMEVRYEHGRWYGLTTYQNDSSLPAAYTFYPEDWMELDWNDEQEVIGLLLL